MNTKLKFAFEKETKGAVRYQEIGEDCAPAFAPQVGTLYIRKSAMPGGKIPKNTYCYNRRRANLISEARVEETCEAVVSHAVHGRGAQRLAEYMARVGRL